MMCAVHLPQLMLLCQFRAQPRQKRQLPAATRQPVTHMCDMRTLRAVPVAPAADGRPHDRRPCRNPWRGPRGARDQSRPTLRNVGRLQRGDAQPRGLCRSPRQVMHIGPRPPDVGAHHTAPPAMPAMRFWCLARDARCCVLTCARPHRATAGRRRPHRSTLAPRSSLVLCFLASARRRRAGGCPRVSRLGV